MSAHRVMSERPLGLSRRRLLQALGSLALVPALPGSAAAAALSPLRPLPPLQLGLLLPEATRLPEVAREFSEGLALALEGQAVTLHPRYYPASSPQAASRTLHQLAAQADGDGLQLVVGLLDPRMAGQAASALAEADLPLLCCDSGANVGLAVEDHAGSPFLSHLSLDYWQSFYRAGHWAASQLGRRAVLAMSWRDSGYDLPFAFSHAFTAAGGEVLARHISFQPQHDHPFHQLEQTLAHSRPDFVCALYAGEDADRFARWWQESGYAKRIPLLSGGLGGALTLVDPAHAPRFTAASWAAEPLQCTAFGSHCQTAGLRPTPYRLLGHDAGQRLLAAWQQAAHDGTALPAALSQVSIISPRGLLQQQAAGVGGQHWLRRGEHSVLTLESVPVATEFLTAVRSPLRSGWLAPYLAA